MAVRAGRLRHRVTLQKPASPTDGEPDKTFTDFSTVAAEVRATGGNERLRGRQVDATVSSMITVRWSRRLADNLAADWKVTHDGRTLSVVACYDPSGRREMFEMQCREAV